MKRFIDIENNIIAIDAITAIRPGGEDGKTLIRLVDGTVISISTDHRFELVSYLKSEIHKVA